MDLRDDLESLLNYDEDELLENITFGMVKQDNIECCVCLNCHWGVRLPNCNHFICPKCYYKIYWENIPNLKCCRLNLVAKIILGMEMEFWR